MRDTVSRQLCEAGVGTIVKHSSVYLVPEEVCGFAGC